MTKRRCISFILLLALLLCACGQKEIEPPEGVVPSETEKKISDTEHQDTSAPFSQEASAQFPKDTPDSFSTEVINPIHIEDPLPPRVYKYFIKVNLYTNTLTVYAKDGGGEYTVPYLGMICSTGEATPQEGVYDLPGTRWPWLSLQGQVYGQYVTQIIGNILFHSVPYETIYDKGSLETEEFNKLGTAASMGCVRLQVADAKWIYDNALDIEGVEFYSDVFPGPLGWPMTPYISPWDARCGWDPTDPDPDNPWNATTAIETTVIE